MKNGKKTVIREGRLSGPYKRQLARKLVDQVVMEEGLTEGQVRRVFSYGYQMLRKGKRK